MLILVGAGIIVYEATHRLVVGSAVERLGVGIAVMGFSVLANLVVSGVLSRQARAHDSPALEGDAAHLRTDALTSAGVLVGLALVQITGIAAFDSITALIVAAAIVSAGIRIIRRSSGVLVDEALPDGGDGPDRGGDRRGPHPRGRRLPQAPRPPRRRAAATSTSMSSTAPGTSLERAHELAHEMRDAIEAEIPAAEVLIHAEPETSLPRSGATAPARIRAG